MNTVMRAPDHDRYDNIGMRRMLENQKVGGARYSLASGLGKIE